tara:strand:+ start:457 stop:564 length:108 start_codon:yes stop_codon:yes gene_type:complete
MLSPKEDDLEMQIVPSFLWEHSFQITFRAFDVRAV